MSPDPRHRYPTALALAEDAERFLRGEPVQASRPTLARRLAWQLSRHRHMIAVMGVTLAFALAFAGAWRAFAEQRSARQTAEREAHALERLEAFKQEMRLLQRARKQETARRALEGFLDLPEVQGTQAVARALLYAGRADLEEGRIRDAIEAYARAYVQAGTRTDQRAALLELSTLFQRTGDGTRLRGLDRLLARGGLDTDVGPELEAHRRAVALVRRDLPELLRRLDPRGLKELGPLGRTFSQRIDTGRRRSGHWSAQRGRGLERGYLDRGARTALVLTPHPGPAPGGQPALVEVTAPPGQLFKEALLDLGWWDGKPFLGVSLMDERTRETSTGLYRLEGTRLELVQPLPLRRLIAGCSGDLDGDGRSEYYLSDNRQLFAALPADGGGFRLVEPHRATNLSNSEIRAVFARDLDHDGRQELVAAVDGWRAYDVRVFRQGETPDRIDLVARRRLGALLDVAPYPRPGRSDGILAVRYVDTADRRAFPESAPTGTPVGTYLLELAGDRLEIVSRVAPPFLSALIGRLAVGDFDGDGRGDFAVQVRVQGDTGADTLKDQIYTQVALGRPDGGFVDLAIPGIYAWAGIEADGDAASELLVEDHATAGMWVLGAGTSPLPPAPASPLEQLSASKGDPPGVVWDRVEDLLSLGLSEPGLEQLSHLAATSADARASARALVRAGELAAAKPDLERAAGFFEAAAARDPASPRPLQLAADTWRRLWHYDRERQALEELLGRSDLSAEARREIDARVAVLRNTEHLPTVSLAFDRPLDPRWHVGAPHLVRRDARRRTLVFRSLTEELELARLPILWRGDRLAFEAFLEMPRLEWGAVFELGIRAAGAPRSQALRFTVDAWGGADMLRQRVEAELGATSQTSLWEAPISGPDGGLPVRLRLEIDPRSGEVNVAINETYTVAHVSPSDLPRNGRLELYLASRPNRWTPGALAEVAVRSIELRGATLEADHRAPPLDEARRLLVEGRYEEAERLTRSSGAGVEAERSALRHLSACRQGQREACLASLGPLLAAGAGRTGLQRSILKEHLRQNPALVLPALAALSGRRALELFGEVWLSTTHAHPEDRSVLLTLATGLNLLDMGRFAPPRGFGEAGMELELLFYRGRAWRLLGQHELARASLQQASALGERYRRLARTDRERADLDELLGDIELDSALSFAASGQSSPTLLHLTRALERSPVPTLLADEAASRPEIAALLEEPGFRTLLRPASYRVPPPRATVVTSDAVSAGGTNERRETIPWP